MSQYNFKEELYHKEISYHHARYINIFFTDIEQTKEFFKYLYFRIKSDYEKYKRGEDVFLHVLRNDNDYLPLIDIDYNFFILVLGEWVEHYSINKNIITEFTRYINITKKNEDDILVNHKVFKNCQIDFSIKERVQFDYSYVGWLIARKRNYRYDLVQILFNNLLGKHTYVRNYSNRYKSIVITPFLLKDNLINKYLRFNSVSFVRKTLATYLTKSEMKLLTNIGDEYEKIISSSRAITSRINKLELDENLIKSTDYFDIRLIEETRDLGDRILHKFVKKDDENNPEFDSDITG